MGLRCLFGHDAVDETMRGTVLTGHCLRCGKPTIRRPGGRIYIIPKRLVARMDDGAAEPVSARKALHVARKRAFIRSRLPRRRSMWSNYYD